MLFVFSLLVAGVDGFEVIPPTATVPPFSPIHFPAANLRRPEMFEFLQIRFWIDRFILFPFGVVVVALFVVVANTAFTLCSTDIVVTSVMLNYQYDITSSEIHV
jgi:hypothetical protein